MEYGVIVYDVPLSRKSVYNKLRQRLGRLSVQMTWSVYLTPLHYKDQVLNILKELDEDEDAKQRIMYRFLKFDAIEQDQLDALVQEQFEASMKKVKDTLYEGLGKAEAALIEGQIDVRDWADARRGSCTKAMKKVKEARRLALLFEVTEVMETAFASLEKLIEAKREEVKEELKKEKEKAEEAAEVTTEAA